MEVDTSRREQAGAEHGEATAQLQLLDGSL